jgi:predicted PP-loop superfamily ATPase
MNCPNCNFDLSLTKRGKTSPENRLFHALVGKLAMWKQIDADTMKMYVKRYASAMHGYECVMVEIDGHKIINPKSVAKATSDELCILINTAYELGMDWGCPLEQTEV